MFAKKTNTLESFSCLDTVYMIFANYTLYSAERV